MKHEYQNFYVKLNKEQKRAVDTIEGPVLVLAGPGAGKTQVLTMRIANILLKTDTPPSAILALTFTESGVRAMRERLVSIVGKTAYYVNIYTFHSFTSDVIKVNQDKFALSSRLEPLSDLERVFMFKEIFDEINLKQIKPFNSPYYYLQTAIARIRDLKREGVDIKEYSLFINQMKDSTKEKEIYKNLELLKVYEAYQKKLIQYGRYDFEDMINFVIDKFKESPDLLSKYQERFQYFLVDEFQDTNSAQAELLYQLNSYWGQNPNLFVVGDDDQSIYRFQGASIENIADFTERYPDSEKFVLTKNYRNIQPILDAAQSLISNNKIRVSSKLKINKSQFSQRKHKENRVIKIGEFSSSYTENHYIAKEIKRLLRKGVQAHDIAIIYRNNFDSIDISDMLSRMGIKYSMEGGENVLETGVIIRLLHLLKVILKVRTNEEDSNLFNLLNYEFIKLFPLDTLKLSRFATKRRLNFFDAIQHSGIKSINFQNLDLIKDFFSKIVEWNKLSANTTFIDFLEQVMETSGYLNWILDQPDSYELLNKLNSFISEVKRLNYSNKKLTLQEFINYVELMRENNISINEETVDLQTAAVRLMTAHKSKGLEFKYVFIPKFIDKKWSNAVVRNLIKLPISILKTVKEPHQEEEDRRLFFVALTRAEKGVYITSAKESQSIQYNKHETVPSMFVQELAKDTINTIKVQDFEKEASEILKQLMKPVDRREVIFDDEKAFLKNALREFKLSASSLNRYLDCPYKFKLELLFNTPAPIPSYFTLGIAVHRSLEMVYKKLKDGISVQFDYLINEFKKALDKAILSDEDMKKIEEEGTALLKIYYETYKNEFHNGNKNVIFLEKFIGWGFSRPMLDNTIRLSGKVDKIELLSQEDKVVKVVDYKTGKPKSRNEILGKTKYSTGDQYRQLLFYKLLLDLDATFNYKVKEVELDYIGHRTSKPKRELFSIDNKDIESLKKTIREVSKNINALKFEKVTKYSVCANCKFRYHCWVDGIPISN